VAIHNHVFALYINIVSIDHELMFIISSTSSLPLTASNSFLIEYFQHPNIRHLQPVFYFLHVN